MDVRIFPSSAHGTVTAPPSKSMAHRLLIAACLSDKQTTVEHIELSEDIAATVDCLRALGAEIRIVADKAEILHGIDLSAIAEGTVLPCRESGSTLRFLLPIALLSDKLIRFTASGRLPQRPLEVYRRICVEQNLYFEQFSDGVGVRGPLRAGSFSLPGDVSSQYITGLLFALPLLDGDSRISLETSLQSASYVDMTLAVLSASGIEVSVQGDREYVVSGMQSYRLPDCRTEGDYSNAAFLAALACMGHPVTVNGLRENSIQGDRAYCEYFSQLETGVPTLDMRDCPDLAPIVMTVAAIKNGATLCGTGRLKLKESDRGAVMAEELAKCGADVHVYEDEIVINRTSLHAPAVALCGHNDHRVVMSLAVLLTKLGGVITGAEAVAKSYPRFFDDLESLGINLELY